MSSCASTRTVDAIESTKAWSITPGRGITEPNTTPRRTTLKPWSRRNAASSAPKPAAAGAIGGDFLAAVTPRGGRGDRRELLHEVHAVEVDDAPPLVGEPPARVPERGARAERRREVGPR